MTSAPLQPELRTPSRRARRGRRPIRALLWVIAALLLGLPLVALAALRGALPTRVVNAVAGLFIRRQAGARPWQPPPAAGATVFTAPDQPVTMLIMGLQVGGAADSPLTDSMMAVSYDPKTGTVGILSIPRDLWVTIPGHGEGRINEAFEDGGAALAMLTVQQNLGIPVNYYALVSYQAFEKLIDDVGGVTVDVPYDINDPQFPAPDEIHYEPLHLSKGVHHLSGHDALRYARERHSTPQGDISRAQQQQQILLALKHQLLQPSNLVRLGQILRDARATVRTNFPFDQMAGLALRVLHVDEAHLHRDVLGYDNQAIREWHTAGGAAVLLPQPEAVRRIVGETFGPALAYLQAGASVRVDNGSGHAGAATGFSKVLAGMGVQTLAPGDADRRDYPTSQVTVYTRDPDRVAEGYLIGGLLGAPVELKEGSGGADVVVTLGRDYAPYQKFAQADWTEVLRPQ